MAQREGSIYLSLFIVAMLLFILSTVAFFIAYNKREELNREVAELEADLRKADGDMLELSASITSLQKLIAGPSNFQAVGTDADSVKRYLSKTANDSLLTVINDAKKDLGEEPVEAFAHLTEPYGLIEAIFDNYREQRDTANQEKNTALAGQTETITEKDRAIQGLNESLEERAKEIVDAQQQYEDCESRFQAEKERSVREIADLQDQILDIQTQSARRDQQNLNQINTLRTRIARLLKEKTLEEEFAELQPDGRLQKVVSDLRKGWVDLGRRDHLMNGLVFQVFQVVKGGRKVPKGKVEVRRVDENSAEVRIVEEFDPLNPINDGDYIASPFYDRAERPIFVLAGLDLASQSITLDFLEAKLKSYGVDLRSEVDINTTFLVALKDYEKTAEYKTAREIGVPLLRERDVLEFIGY